MQCISTFFLKLKVYEFMVLFFQLELNFARALKERRGFLIKEMAEDGACLFRAVGK